jgi:4-hydroxy-3-methylbut-2-enyl diphosphate reductase
MTGENEQRELPNTSKLLVTAHGISDRERRRLEAAGKQLIDTTCPLVTRVHETARRLERSGHHVIVLGRPGHVEVRGIVGDLVGYTVVAVPDDVRAWPYPKLGVVAQSTFMQATARQLVGLIERHNPRAAVVWEDTICDPTKRRVQALDELLSRVDAVVVVGGRNSHNTRQLVAACQARSIRAWHVQGAADLDPCWFLAGETVGLTAGTSTPDATIAEVRIALLALPGRSSR